MTDLWFASDPSAAEKVRLCAEDDAEQRAAIVAEGYHAALDDLSILLAEEVQRLEDGYDDHYALVVGLRRALAIVRDMR